MYVHSAITLTLSAYDRTDQLTLNDSEGICMRRDSSRYKDD